MKTGDDFRFDRYIFWRKTTPNTAGVKGEGLIVPENSKLEAQPPPVLYKYRDWSEPFHRKLLTKGEFFFSSTKDLNDPFEAVVPIRYDHGTDEQWQRNCEKHVRSMNRRLNEEWVSKTARDILNLGEYKRPETAEYQRQKSKEQMEDCFGVFSLTTKNDNPLMWAHYADDHRGFCVGLDTNRIESDSLQYLEKTDNILSFYAVEYHDKFPFLDGHEGKWDELIPRILRTKSEHWKYEEEWRLLLIHGKPSARTGLYTRAIRFPLDVVKEVVFGLRMDGDSRKCLTLLLQRLIPECRLFQVSQNSQSFNLVVEPVP